VGVIVIGVAAAGVGVGSEFVASEGAFGSIIE
jgi:hypothetical protein